MEKENDKDTIVNSSREETPVKIKKHKKEKKSKKRRRKSSSSEIRTEKKKANKRDRSSSSRDTTVIKENALMRKEKEKERNENFESLKNNRDLSEKKDKYLNKYKDKDISPEDKKARERLNESRENVRKISREKDKEIGKEKKKEKDRKKESNKQGSRSRSRNKYRSKSRSKSRSRSRDKDRDRKRKSSHERSKRSRSRDRNKSKEKERDRERERERDKERERNRDYSRRVSDRDRDRDRERRRHSYSRSQARNRSKSSSKYKTGTDKLPLLDEIARFTSENAPISTSDPSKRDRELYVSNVPKGLTPNDVITLLNTALVAIEANLKPGDPILSAWINVDQNYALLEFRCPKEANNAFKLNGLKIIDKEIKIGRPRYEGESTNQPIKDMFPTLTGFEKDLNNPLASNNTTAAYISSHSVTQTVLPTCSKLLVSNLPLNFDEEAVYKILKYYGPIKSLEMIKDPITGNYSGQCHVEYENEKATSKALHYLMGINIQGNILYIKRSSGLVPTYSVTGGNAPTSLGILTNGLTNQQQQYMTAEDYVKFRENTSSKVICIRNMVNLKDLEDEDEYDDLTYDVREECKIYGKVVDIKIPRSEVPGEMVSGLGKIFVEFATRDGANCAKENLNGKSFNGRFVEVVFHPEEMYRKNQLD